MSNEAAQDSRENLAPVASGGHGDEASARVGRANVSRGVLVAVVGAAVMGIVLALWAPSRGLDGDEGFYLTAGRHVAEGRRLYADVFYPQMPYLPWIESLLFRAFGVSLDVVRYFSVVTAALGAGLLAWLVWRVEGSLAAALLAIALYIAHGVSLNMLPLAKTYAVGNLFLLLAFAPFALDRVRQWPWALVAGCAAGCAIGVRLPTAAVAAVLAVLAARQGMQAFASFALGGLIGSAGWLLAAARHPDEFWFCNVAFHSLRREMSGTMPILVQKLRVIAKWLFLPQHLVIASLIGVAFWIGARRWAALLCLVALAAAYAVATPTYLQYMAQFFPFALLACAPALVLVARSRMRTALVLAVYLVGIYPAVRAVSGEHELSRKRTLWDRKTVTEVTNFLRAHTNPGEPLLSWWEGYPVLSDRPGFIGVGFWESNVAKKLNPELARHYHVMRQEEVAAVIQAREPAAIIRTSDVWRQHNAAITAGYRLAHEVADIQIYVRKEPQMNTDKH